MQEKVSFSSSQRRNNPQKKSFLGWKATKQRTDREITPNDISKVGDVVDVGEGAGDEDVTAARDRKLGGILRRCVLHR